MQQPWLGKLWALLKFKFFAHPEVLVYAENKYSKVILFMLLNLTVLGRETTTPAAKKTFRGQITSPKEGGGGGGGVNL